MNSLAAAGPFLQVRVTLLFQLFDLFDAYFTGCARVSKNSPAFLATSVKAVLIAGLWSAIF